MDDRQLKIGFEKAGQWELDKDTIRANFTMHAEQHNVLYAFACDGEVLYVGQSKRTLRKRMGNYSGSTLKDRSTNGRNKSFIIELLKTGLSVDIYALPDSGLMHYGEFHMSLAAALEESIIRALKPRWNWRPGKDGETVLVTERNDVIPASGEANCLEVDHQDVPPSSAVSEGELLSEALDKSGASSEGGGQPNWTVRIQAGTKLLESRFLQRAKRSFPFTWGAWRENRNFLRRRANAVLRKHQSRQHGPRCNAPSFEWYRTEKSVSKRS